MYKCNRNISVWQISSVSKDSINYLCVCVWEFLRWIKVWDLNVENVEKWVGNGK